MIDLTTVLFEQRRKPRGDEAALHVSDLYGCDRASWYRRRGEKPLPFTPERLALFAQGFSYERGVAQTLIDAGEAVRTGVEVWLDDFVGHTDIVLDEHRVVVDTKLTELRKPKAHVSPHYAVQVAAYAMALGCDDAIVLVYHAGSRIEAQYHVHVDGLATDEDGEPFGPLSEWEGCTWRDIVERRMAQVRERTSSDVAPSPNPGELSKWGCKYCDWAQCPENPKFDEVVF
jgi:hypothetical protein